MSKAERKAAKAAQIASEVKNCIVNKHILIEIYKVFPQGESPKVANGSYTIKLYNDSLTCHLPYYGNSKTPIYGGQGQSIETTKQKVESICAYDQKTESHIIQFSLKNENTMDKWGCTLQIFNNKTAYVAITNPSKSNITFTGEIITEKLQ